MGTGKCLSAQVIDVISFVIGLEPEDIKIIDETESVLGADSLDMFDIFSMLKEEFNIKIYDESVASKKNLTVGDIIKLVEEEIE